LQLLRRGLPTEISLATYLRRLWECDFSQPAACMRSPCSDPGRRSPGSAGCAPCHSSRIGEIALPGGYINYGETWQEAGAREIFEEANVTIDPAEITEFRVRSAPDGTLIIFGLAHPRHLDALPPFQSNSEASQRLILFEPAPMAFELHTEIAGQFLNAK
jgi:ADP-ribose pyrophosphatase YjhB (NUDIX family)